MITAKETSIGPAVKFLRHFAEHQRFYRIKFGSGERALVLIAGMPVPSVKLVRLALGGVIPWQTVWEYNPIRAGGFSDYLHKLKTMFSPALEGSDDSSRYICDALLGCRSIQEARILLLERERLANHSTADVAIDFPGYEPRSIAKNDDWQLGIDSEPEVAAPKGATIPAVPKRYRIRNEAKQKVLTCVEAPTITVRAELGLAISAKQARSYRAGAIFLDGAAQGEPFIDIQREVYNLDHHQGCIRSSATCEQAMVLVRKGLDLRKRDWVVLANDADLDTILALWVLFNHLRLNEDPEVRAKVIPLLRLQGVIDTHGLEMQDLAALPPDLVHSTSAMLKHLQKQEGILKSYGRWSEMDLVEYIADRLCAVDDLIYSPENFEQYHEVDELARAEIANGSVAVACRSDAGVDEVKRQLQRIYGERLGIVIVQDADLSYRMHQIDRSVPVTLDRAYERLNLLDPAVTSGSENRWGGSPESGGSPRKTGTGLIPTQIIGAIREAFGKPTFVDVISEIPRAAFLAVAALLPAVALIFAGHLLRDRGYIAVEAIFVSSVVLTITAGLLFWLKARRVPGLYGWRAPTSFGWLNALPVAFIGAVTGGAWAPGSVGYRMGPANLYEFNAPAALLFPLAAELLFRGVLLGQLAARLPMQKGGGLGSWPTIMSSVLYAASTLLLFLSFSNGQLHISQWVLIVAGALIFGVAAGIARERSESILSSVLLHWVCAAALLLSQNLRF